MVHTVAPLIVHIHVQPHFEDQHHIYHAPESYDEEEKRHEDINGMKESLHILEKSLRVMEGDKFFGAAAREICLVSGLVIPTNFKTLDFDKYEVGSCPKSNLIMYYRKTAAHV